MINNMQNIGIISGQIVEGIKHARLLNIPTINIEISVTENDDYELEPGVWAGLTKYNDEIWASCLYIHEQYESKHKVEIHILNIDNFSCELGSFIECRCLHKVRSIMNFTNMTIEEIKNQLSDDKQNCINFFND